MTEPANLSKSVRPFARGIVAAVWMLLALTLTGLALVTVHSNDEDQYVAATFLAHSDTMYAKFLYLQTPLQPYLFRHLLGIWQGHDFLILRLSNSVCAFIALVFTYACQRKLQVPDRLALISVVAMAGCVLFQFSASVARNDALPAALLTISMWLIADHAQPYRNGHVWLASGLLLGLAACAKITFALPGGALGMWLIWQVISGRTAWHMPFSLALGAMAGLLPLIYAAMLEPDAVLYGVWEAAAHDTTAWYHMNGRDDLLSLSRSLFMMPIYLAQGPALVAVALLAVRWRKLPAESQPLVALLIGGLLAALVPSPMWRQYLLPALPPLFALFGLALTSLAGTTQRNVVRLTLGVALLATASNLGDGLHNWWQTGLPNALRTTAEAHWIGDQLRAQGWRGGQVATLSPSLVIDSGFDLDRRFSTGSNVFHTGHLQSPARLEALNAVGPQTIYAALDNRAPIAIVTGYEGRRGNNRAMAPDAWLDAWAESRGYERVKSPAGDTILWIRARGADDGV